MIILQNEKQLSRFQFFYLKQPKKAVFQNGSPWSSFLPNVVHILTAFWGKMCVTVCVFHTLLLCAQLSFWGYSNTVRRGCQSEKQNENTTLILVSCSGCMVYLGKIASISLPFLYIHQPFHLSQVSHFFFWNIFLCLSNFTGGTTLT